MIIIKKNAKILSIIIVLTFILSLIPLRDIIIRAVTENKPQFTIKSLSANPDPSIKGDDITVNGTLKSTIQDTTTINKEIVIVLDISKNNNNGGFNKIVNPLKNFIGKLKTDKLAENLKIGIVTYNSNAEIAEINNQKLIDINNEKDNDSGEIKKYLGNLKPNKSNVNKNIGEALRQAVYLLDSNGENKTNAEKTIILIGEGNPDSRTVDSKGNMYLDTTKYKEDSNKTNIITSDSEKGLQYAEAVGNIIKNKGYNVFTIGIDLDSKNEQQRKIEIQNLEKIHSSMIGSNLKKEDYENYGLFLDTTDPSYNRKTIEAIFSTVSDKITKNYAIKNATMDLTFTSEFTAKNQAKSINLNPIYYKAVNSNNKIIYTADIPFSFVMNSKKVGANQKVLDSIRVNYLWNGTSINEVINTDLKVTVNSNEAPNILAKLESDSIIDNADKNSPITLKYSIDPKEFTTNNVDFNKESIGEVIFIIDISSKMNKDQRWSYFKNAITNKIINSDDFKNIKFGVVTYDDYAYIGDRKRIDQPKEVEMKSFSSNINLLKPLFDVSDANSKDGYRMLYQNDIIKISNSNNRNFTNAVNAAKKVFDNFGNSNVRKAIVLINTGSVSYDSTVLNDIKSKGYKIISLDISNQTNTNLRQLHESLGGIYNSEKLKSDYILGTFDNSGNYNTTDQDMQEVADRLKGGVTNKNTINPEFEFNLNNNFEYVQGTASGIKSVTTDGNKLKFSLANPIEYSYSGEMRDGRYIFKANKPSDIYFSVKVKDNNNLKLEFGNSYMRYNKFDLTTESKKLDTPIVNLKQEVKNISHGLYNGIIGNKVYIQENDNKAFEIAQGATVTFSSRFTLGGSNVTFDLNLDKNFNSVDINNIKVYKVLTDSSGNNTLMELARSIEDNEDNKFKIAINNVNENNQPLGGDILVIYQARVKEGLGAGYTLTNKIIFSNTSKDVGIITPQPINQSPSLPDLF